MAVKLSSLDHDILGLSDFMNLAECSTRLHELHALMSTRVVRFVTTSHMVRYFAADFWSALPGDWQKSLLLLNDASLAALPSAVLPQDCESESLTEFVTSVRKAILPRAQSALSDELVANQPGYFIDHQMSPKKSHEVRLMAALVAAIAKDQGIQQTVDVGSGKGYLSEALALQHKLTVVGVDACETNVHGAEKRTNLLRRYYNGLVKRAQRLEMEKAAEALVNTPWKSSEEDLAGREPVSSLSACAASNGSSHSQDGGKMLCNCTTATAQSSTAASAEVCLSSSVFEHATRGSAEACFAAGSADLVAASRSCLPAALDRATTCSSGQTSNYEESETQAKRSYGEAPAGQAPVDHSNTHSEDCVSAQSLQSFQRKAKDRLALASHTPVVGMVQQDEEDFMGFLAQRSHGCIDIEKPLLLTGLHTCGNLASTSLRLFAHCPNLRALCAVGCCYHLLTESQEAEEACADGSMEDRDYKLSPREDWRGKGGDGPLGFPLSRLSAELQPQLGINARMLACQAPDRMCSPGEPPSHLGIFWRAVFQVILVEKFGRDNNSRRNNVGRQTAKSKSFQDYTRRCMRKLEIEQSEISDAEIDGYLQRFSGRQRELQAFAQLRAMVSAVAESFIIVDRITFLLEQPHIETACAVPLFDPVTSPRNLVIVATKKKKLEG